MPFLRADDADGDRLGRVVGGEGLDLGLDRGEGKGPERDPSP
jgi:hypothetical protein